MLNQSLVLKYCCHRYTLRKHLPPYQTQVHCHNQQSKYTIVWYYADWAVIPCTQKKICILKTLLIGGQFVKNKTRYLKFIILPRVCNKIINIHENHFLAYYYMYVCTAPPNYVLFFIWQELQLFYEIGKIICFSGKYAILGIYLPGL